LMLDTGFGPRRIRCEFERRQLVPVGRLPSASAIYRALTRAGLVEPVRRHRRSERFKRWERAAPMELWPARTDPQTRARGPGAYGCE
jgi:hypothetical protein